MPSKNLKYLKKKPWKTIAHELFIYCKHFVQLGNKNFQKQYISL